jgi:predicted DNA-binding transcriptional regulator
MARDRAIGSALVVGAVIGVFVYGFLLFYPFSANSKIALYTLEVTAFVAVLGILAILGWIGYVMATTPPPVPLEPEPVPSPDSSTDNQNQSGMTSEKKA